MELTLYNLIEVISADLCIETRKINKNTVISKYTDGYPAEDLLNKIEKDFNVSFKSFDFYKYFHSEIEITKSISFLNLLRLRKIREIKKLTVGELYEYMKNNKKQE